VFVTKGFYYRRIVIVTLSIFMEVFKSIGIYKSPKKFLCWGLKRGFPFSGLRRVLRMLASVEGNHRVP
jgi:hypothetical protein